MARQVSDSDIEAELIDVCGIPWTNRGRLTGMAGTGFVSAATGQSQEKGWSLRREVRPGVESVRVRPPRLAAVTTRALQGWKLPGRPDSMCVNSFYHCCDDQFREECCVCQVLTDVLEGRGAEAFQRCGGCQDFAGNNPEG